MKIDNPFDQKLVANKQLPVSTVDALTEVTDTLDFAWASARAVFEEAATPDHAIKICEMMVYCIHRNRDKVQKILNTGGESGD